MCFSIDMDMVLQKLSTMGKVDKDRQLQMDEDINKLTTLFETQKQELDNLN